MSQKEKLAALAEDVEQVDWDQFVVKGTQQELEKSYFRLTSAPAPSTVRPEAVLRRSYDRLVRLLREDKENYFYALDQFKGMRQDCTVQHLRNDLTVCHPACLPFGGVYRGLVAFLMFHDCRTFRWSVLRPGCLHFRWSV